ncbi:MAG: ABC transporter ATP-binding protein [Erysipelotrichales bacterium]|nr:ABC transporter ATP-binding protein [Erysipelotrichales bacterium]
MGFIKKNQKIALVLLCILNVFRSGCLIAVTLLTRSLINTAVSGEENLFSDLLKYSICLFSVVLLQIALRICFQFINNKYAIRYELDLKQQIYGKFINKELSSIQKIHSGEMSNLYMSDVRNIVDGYFKLIPNVVLNVSTFVFSFIALMVIDYIFLLAALLLGVVIYLLSLPYGKYVKKFQKKVLESNGELTAYMQESVENIKLIKANSVEENAKNILENKAEKNYKIKHRFNNFAIIGSTGMMSIFNLTYIFALIYGAFMLFKRPDIFSYGELVALLRLVNYFESPISALSDFLNGYYAFKVSKQRISNIDYLTDEINDEEVNDFDSIVFDHVSFSYDKLVLNDLSLEIKKQEIWALKGPSGIGKTTMLNLILGFIVPTSGNIYIKYKDKHYPVSKATRKLFSYVPQENILFSGTIRDNIDLFAPNSKEEDIQKCLTLAGIINDINEMPLKLDTKLNERGVGLSLGQIQRILIAISLLKDKPILLLDEFTSALDKDIEKEIINNLVGLDKTIILITHRDINVAGLKEFSLRSVDYDQ